MMVVGGGSGHVAHHFVFVVEIMMMMMFMAMMMMMVRGNRHVTHPLFSCFNMINTRLLSLLFLIIDILLDFLWFGHYLYLDIEFWSQVFFIAEVSWLSLHWDSTFYFFKSSVLVYGHHLRWEWELCKVENRFNFQYNFHSQQPIYFKTWQNVGKKFLERF